MWLTAKVLDVMKNKLFLDCGLIHGQIQKPKVCWGLYRHMWPIMWKNEMPWNTHWWVYPKHIFFMILWDDPFILWKRNTSMKILGEITNVHEIHEFISKFTKSRKNTKTTKIARKYTNHENTKKRVPWKSVKRPWKKPSWPWKRREKREIQKSSEPRFLSFWKSDFSRLGCFSDTIAVLKVFQDLSGSLVESWVGFSHGKES